MSWAEARGLCVSLAIATHTGLDFWMECEVDELRDYAEEVARLQSSAKE